MGLSKIWIYLITWDFQIFPSFKSWIYVKFQNSSIEEDTWSSYQIFARFARFELLMFNVHFLISETFRDLPRISRTFGIFWFLRKNDSMTRMTPGSSAVRKNASLSSIRIRIRKVVKFQCFCFKFKK